MPSGWPHSQGLTDVGVWKPSSLASRWDKLRCNICSRAPYRIRLRLRPHLNHTLAQLPLILYPAFPTLLPVSPRRTFLINYLHINPCLKFCFQSSVIPRNTIQATNVSHIYNLKFSSSNI